MTRALILTTLVTAKPTPRPATRQDEVLSLLKQHRTLSPRRMADMLGTTCESVVRTLRTLREKCKACAASAPERTDVLRDAAWRIATPADIDATVYRTGLAFEVPPGWCMEVHSRSGHGFNHAIRLSNCTGIIDSDYRGEVLVALRCEAYRRQPMPRKGDRVAQAKLVPAPQVTFQVVDQLSDTARGTGGFGSTGE